MGNRPCQYCVAGWAEPTTKGGSPRPIVPDPEDCKMAHRDDPRVYALALAMAKVFQSRDPSDAQISYFLSDADEVVDDFTEVVEEWKVRKLPPSPNDGSDGIEIRMRINDLTYVGLEGGHKERGQTVRLSTFRSWSAET